MIQNILIFLAFVLIVCILWKFLHSKKTKSINTEDVNKIIKTLKLQIELEKTTNMNKPLEKKLKNTKEEAETFLEKFDSLNKERFTSTIEVSPENAYKFSKMVNKKINELQEKQKKQLKEQIDMLQVFLLNRRSGGSDIERVNEKLHKLETELEERENKNNTRAINKQITSLRKEIEMRGRPKCSDGGDHRIPISQENTTSKCPSERWSQISNNICQVEGEQTCGYDCSKQECLDINGRWLETTNKDGPFTCEIMSSEENKKRNNIANISKKKIDEAIDENKEISKETKKTIDDMDKDAKEIKIEKEITDKKIKDKEKEIPKLDVNKKHLEERKINILKRKEQELKYLQEQLDFVNSLIKSVEKELNTIIELSKSASEKTDKAKASMNSDINKAVQIAREAEISNKICKDKSHEIIGLRENIVSKFEEIKVSLETAKQNFVNQNKSVETFENQSDTIDIKKVVDEVVNTISDKINVVDKHLISGSDEVEKAKDMHEKMKNTYEISKQLTESLVAKNEERIKKAEEETKRLAEIKENTSEHCPGLSCEVVGSKCSQGPGYSCCNQKYMSCENPPCWIPGDCNNIWSQGNNVTIKPKARLDLYESDGNGWNFMKFIGTKKVPDPKLIIWNSNGVDSLKIHDQNVIAVLTAYIKTPPSKKFNLSIGTTGITQTNLYFNKNDVRTPSRIESTNHTGSGGYKIEITTPNNQQFFLKAFIKIKKGTSGSYRLSFYSDKTPIYNYPSSNFSHNENQPLETGRSDYRNATVPPPPFRYTSGCEVHVLKSTYKKISTYANHQKHKTDIWGWFRDQNVPKNNIYTKQIKTINHNGSTFGSNISPAEVIIVGYLKIPKGTNTIQFRMESNEWSRFFVGKTEDTNSFGFDIWNAGLIDRQYTNFDAMPNKMNSKVINFSSKTYVPFRIVATHSGRKSFKIRLMWKLNNSGSFVDIPEKNIFHRKDLGYSCPSGFLQKPIDNECLLEFAGGKTTGDVEQICKGFGEWYRPVYDYFCRPKNLTKETKLCDWKTTTQCILKDYEMVNGKCINKHNNASYNGLDNYDQNSFDNWLGSLYNRDNSGDEHGERENVKNYAQRCKSEYNFLSKYK